MEQTDEPNSQDASLPPAQPVQPTTEEKSNPQIESIGSDIVYYPCKYCKGVIPKGSKKSPNLVYCAKICSETSKMVPTENYVVPENGVFDTRGKDWTYYKEVLREKSSPRIIFGHISEYVKGLEAGMKLEALDVNNPVNYCVATVVKIIGHRLCIRYDGFGAVATHDFWCSFQAEELFPIGWCAQHGYALQPPTGITSTLSEWKAFLTKTLTGALAAPHDLFKKSEARRQLRCHPYQNGNKVEVIHPKRPDLIVPATITKSLGPYYFLVATDVLPGLPTCSFYGYVDCPGVYPVGWCESKGLELVLPSSSKLFADLKMIRKPANTVDTSTSLQKKNRLNPFRFTQKLEALDGEIVRVATVAEVFGRVSLLVFDGTSRKKFFDKNSTEVFPIGWCERTECILSTPYGQVDFCKASPEKKIKHRGGNINSASFGSFQQAAAQSATSTQKVIVVHEEKEKEKFISTQTQDPNIDVDISEASNVDIDIDLPLSPTSPGDRQKCDMEQFVVWLINSYDYVSSDTECVVKPELVEHFTNTTNIRLSPRWFSLIYKLFPGVSTVRRCIDGKFVNCFKNLKTTNYEDTSAVLYIKKAIELLNTEGVSVIMAEDKLVAYMGVGEKYNVPEDPQELFMYGKAKENSRLLVVCGELAPDFTINNFFFAYENNTCKPPLQKITTQSEFRALLKLCKQARMCRGMPIVPKADNTTPNYRMGKYVKNGRLYSSICNVIAYPHKNFICTSCKMIRTHSRPSVFTNSFPQSSEQESADTLDVSYENRDDIDDTTPSKDEEDNSPSPDIRIYFNTACRTGMYLDPNKVVQMVTSTNIDRPAQALKYLVERLLEVSYNKEKLLEIIEAGFGTRIFNKNKDKVVKKGLFRFNTKKKVVKFLRRLTKRLNCCDYFLNIEQKSCGADCVRTLPINKDDVPQVSSPPYVSSNANGSIPHPVSIASGTRMALPASGNVQVLYQLPPTQSMPQTPTTPGTPGTPHIVLQTPQGQNVNLKRQFPQGTQFFVPSHGNNLTYMVVSKENLMHNARLPVTVNSEMNPSSMHSPMNSPSLHSSSVSAAISSPSSGVTQMMANIVNTNLVTDIDDPTKHKTSQPLQISVVKGNGPSNQQILIKKNTYQHEFYEKQPHSADDTLHLSNNKCAMSNSHSYQEDARAAMYYSNHRDVSRQTHDNNMSSSDKAKQIHVHKVHHGNARVKYVEFKPVGDGMQQRVHTPHSYHPNFKQQQQQQMHYPNRLPGPHQSNQHLSVHTHGHAPKSPLHSPPALRPPPPVPSRSIALSSPPSLLPSPDVRPRFDFAGNNTSCSTTNVHSPVQVTNLNHQGKFMHGGKPVHFVGNQSITLPRLPSSYQLSPLVQPNSPVLARGKVTAFQTVRTDGSVVQDSSFNSENTAPVSSTNNMTYIPLHSTGKDKVYYVPVNSLQSSQGQQVVLYQNNQHFKDQNGKPVTVTPSAMQKATSMMGDDGRGHTGQPFTTVRIQGMQRGGMMQSSPMSRQQQFRMFKYQFAGTNNQERSPSRTNHFNQDRTGQRQDNYVEVKTEHVEDNDNDAEIMLHINDQLRKVPPQVGIQHTETKIPMVPVGSKRANTENEMRKSNETSSLGPSSQDRVEDKGPEDSKGPTKVKKRRGRPARARNPDGTPRSKLSMMQVNPLSSSQAGNPLTLANRVLTETFYRKQQQIQNRPNFFEDPLQKLPDLHPNPENWSSDDVFKFLSETDCSSYASVLMDEEVDGKSFLLLTSEALMEFMGMRLGPALKISGHAAYLRAKHRMEGMSTNGQLNHREQPSRLDEQTQRGRNKENKRNEKHEKQDIVKKSTDLLEPQNSSVASAVDEKEVLMDVGDVVAHGEELKTEEEGAHLKTQEKGENPKTKEEEGELPKTDTLEQITNQQVTNIVPKDNILTAPVKLDDPPIQPAETPLLNHCSTVDENTDKTEDKSLDPQNVTPLMDS